MERRRRPVQQPLHSRPQSVRLELRLRRCSRGSAHCAALATETDGSIVCPASQCGVVGIKPTVGLTSRAGVVPISHTQDTVGTHGRSVADCGRDARCAHRRRSARSATAASEGHFYPNYTQFVDPHGLQGARIGVATTVHRRDAGDRRDLRGRPADAARRRRSARRSVEIPTFDEFNADPSEIIVLIFEFKRDLNAYLATRSGVPVARSRTASSSISITSTQELQFFGQEWMELAEGDTYSQAEYEQALITGPALAGAHGIDATLAANNVRRDRRTDEHARVADRPDQRRRLPVRQLGLRGGRGLSARHGDQRVRVRSARGPHVHGVGVERADADPARRGLRGRGGCAASSEVPAHVQPGRQEPRAQQGSLDGCVGGTRREQRDATSRSAPGSVPGAASAPPDVPVTSRWGSPSPASRGGQGGGALSSCLPLGEQLLLRRARLRLGCASSVTLR